MDCQLHLLNRTTAPAYAHLTYDGVLPRALRADGCLLGASDRAGRPIGAAAAVFSEGGAELCSLLVEEGFRRRGVGSLLVRGLKLLCQKRRCDTLTLSLPIPQLVRLDRLPARARAQRNSRFGQDLSRDLFPGAAGGTPLPETCLAYLDAGLVRAFAACSLLPSGDAYLEVLHVDKGHSPSGQKLLLEALRSLCQAAPDAERFVVSGASETGTRLIRHYLTGFEDQCDHQTMCILEWRKDMKSEPISLEEDDLVLPRLNTLQDTLGQMGLELLMALFKTERDGLEAAMYMAASGGQSE